jgi:hypothetical protein
VAEGNRTLGLVIEQKARCMANSMDKLFNPVSLSSLQGWYADSDDAELNVMLGSLKKVGFW